MPIENEQSVSPAEPISEHIASELEDVRAEILAGVFDIERAEEVFRMVTSARRAIEEVSDRFREATREGSVLPGTSSQINTVLGPFAEELTRHEVEALRWLGAVQMQAGQANEQAAIEVMGKLINERDAGA